MTPERILADHRPGWVDIWLQDMYCCQRDKGYRRRADGRLRNNSKKQ
jgi:hypothetical protein